MSSFLSDVTVSLSTDWSNLKFSSIHFTIKYLGRTSAKSHLRTALRIYITTLLMEGGGSCLLHQFSILVLKEKWWWYPNPKEL